MSSQIEIEATKRRVTVRIGNTTIAESTRAQRMTEGDLPVRHYLPSEDVMMEMLEPSETVTHCPYKGDARYWNVTVGGSEFKDMVWSYSTPLEEVSAIAGLLCFYDERVSLEVGE